MVRNYLGVRSNCELLAAYLGLWEGMLAGFLMMAGRGQEIVVSDVPGLAIVFAIFALILLTVFFVFLYGQRFADIVVPSIVPSIIIGFLMAGLMFVLRIPYFEPFIYALVGVLIGGQLGRALCAVCDDQGKKEE